MAKRSDNELSEYRRKRDPVATNEPFDAPPTRSAGTAKRTTWTGAFVCHLHAASRLHYDLRLEMGGVLLSFAVPKGPSLKSLDKRLAVQTEHHPLPYVDFEDVIPEGNYGAGAMIVWDRGRIRYLEKAAEEGLEIGKLDFELSGFKLRGRFALVKTSGRKEPEKPGDQPLWLLIKKTDKFNQDDEITETAPKSVLSGLTVEELPRLREIGDELVVLAKDAGAKTGTVDARRTSPMLCALEGAELDDPDYLYELKLDGVRILASKSASGATLTYRTGRSATHNYPEVVRAIRALAPRDLVLDGEIVTFDEAGRPDFQKLARRIHATKPSDIQYAMVSVPVTYLCFDILQLGEYDLRDLPLMKRREILAQVVRGKGPIRTLDYLDGQGEALFEFCRTQSLEGVVGKRKQSKYMVGPTRYPDWVKFKCERDDDFVVVGFTVGEGGRQRLGALDVAAYEGEKLVVRGKVGSGLSEEAIDHLLTVLEPLVADEPTAEGTYDSAKRGRKYVLPKLVVTVRYLGYSDGGHLRFPVFKGLRDGVDPKACTTGPNLSDDAILTLAAPQTATKANQRVAGAKRVPLTNQNKVFWPEEGYTKGDLCDYYDAIGPTLLPHLKDRPIMLVRYPDGVDGKSFYQWRIPKGAPPWIRSYPVRTEKESGKDVTTFIADDVDTLLYIANLGCIPLHVLAGRVATLDQCDFLTIDFDLNGSEFQNAIILARELRSILDEIGLEGFPKTSGQTGLHVFVPLGPGASYATAKMLGELLGRVVQKRHPEISTMERMKDKRGERVYIDTGQTGRSRTIVAPWSVRAFPGARVSTPLSWDEVSFALDPGRFTIFTVLERVERVGDPMVKMFESRPDLPEVIEGLRRIL